MFKALEQNIEFETEMLLARKNIGIPETGISWKDYYKNYYFKRMVTYSGDENKKLSNFYSKLDTEVVRIKKKFNLDSYVANQLDNLIIGGFVFSEDFPISYEANPIDDFEQNLGYKDILIKISHKVTQHELITYIKDNWKNIEKILKLLPTKPKYYISKKSFRIVELKDKEGLGLKDITDKVAEEFGNDDSDGRINEISVPRAYRRAKARINLITHKHKEDK